MFALKAKSSLKLLPYRKHVNNSNNNSRQILPETISASLGPHVSKPTIVKDDNIDEKSQKNNTVSTLLSSSKFTLRTSKICKHPTLDNQSQTHARHRAWLGNGHSIIMWLYYGLYIDLGKTSKSIRCKSIPFNILD